MDSGNIQMKAIQGRLDTFNRACQFGTPGVSQTDSVSLGKGASSPPGGVYNLTQAGAAPGNSALKAMKEQIDMMKTMRDLMSAVGNTAKVQEMQQKIEARQKEMDAFAASPPPVFSPALKDSIKSYMQARGPIPQELDNSQRECLERIKSLADNGMAFQTSRMQSMSAEDAYVHLMENPVPSLNDQVRYTSYENGGMSACTLRPAYVKPLEHFVANSKKGYVFFEKTEQGMVPVKSARMFMEKFKEHPEDALVQAEDGTFTTIEKADKIKQDMDLQELKDATAPKEKPDIYEDDNFIAIGGIMLKKNTANCYEEGVSLFAKDIARSGIMLEKNTANRTE